MEWAERMNSAISYIEENLAGEIDYGEAAMLACCSTFHFQRIFFVVIGMTLAEYVRRRRLTLAAKELSSDKARVLDIAVKYGYDSPDAFTRAFRNMHGVTPQAAREPGVQLVAYPRVSCQVILKGGNSMDYNIVEKPAFNVTGAARKFTAVNGENFIEVPKFWTEFKKTRDYQSLLKLNDGKLGPVTGGEVLGVCLPEDKDKHFQYAIAVEGAAKTAKGFEVIHIPTATWAVFDGKGAMSDAMNAVWKTIIQEWFPSTGYEPANTPDLEVYFPGNVDSSDYRFQVWIPVKKKKR